MTLTKGQKRVRDMEAAEAKTVTDPNMIWELLDSRFAKANAYILLLREDVQPLLFQWWQDSFDWLKEKEPEWLDGVCDRYPIESLSEEDLIKSRIVEINPQRILLHGKCGDTLLIEIANIWSNIESSCAFDSKWRGKDASFRDVPRPNKKIIDDISSTVNVKQLKRMYALAKQSQCRMPPPLVKPVIKDNWYAGGKQKMERWEQSVRTMEEPD
jgi:hypothetical protein